MSENLNAPVDLHSHTAYSDGELTPIELLDYASDRGVAVIAITDHDTVDAYFETDLLGHAESRNIELVPGVEVSTSTEGRRYHVIGLCINIATPELITWLNGLQSSREAYAFEVIEMLNNRGWDINPDVLETGQIHTKANVANAVVKNGQNHTRLLREFGYIPNRGEFIEAYMNPGQDCYVERDLPTHQEAIEVIHGASGLAFLAHPVAYMFEQGMDAKLISDELNRSDFDGLEAIYYYYNKSGGDQEIDEISLFTGLAKSHNLLISGGSDFHGTSPLVGNYMDLGYEDKTVFPTLGLLRAIQQAARINRQS